VAGTATAVSGSVSRKQNAKAQQQAAEQQPVAPAQPAPAHDDKIEKLKQLGELKNAGILTDEEFAAEKAKILNS
jgi:membrane protease subunit (stomatin/prohibitin family)